RDQLTRSLTQHCIDSLVNRPILRALVADQKHHGVVWRKMAFVGGVDNVLTYATEFQLGNCSGMLLLLIPFFAECHGDLDWLLGLDVYVRIAAVIARPVDTSRVIVSGVVLCGCVVGTNSAG